MNLKHTYFILLILFVSSCKTDNLSVSDYVQWIGKKDNGLYKNKNIDNFQFSCMYRPIDWIAIHEITNQKLNMEKYDSIHNAYEGLQYFALKIVNPKAPELISYKAESDQSLYHDNFNYYTGGMKNDIYLVDNQDTLPCILFHYERNYGASPINIFDIAFKSKDDNISEKQLIFNGEYMGVGIIKFDFEKNDLISIPKLKLN